MKLKFFIYFILFFSLIKQSKGQALNFSCDSNNFTVFKQYKGHLLNQNCDTVYLLNRFTFDLLFRSYNDYKIQNAILLQYAQLNDSIQELYKSQLDTQEAYFDTLNTSFTKLADASETLVIKSKANLDSITTNLSSIESQIKSAKTNISMAQADIELAKKQIKKEKWKWAAFGFASGGALVFILAVLL